MDITVTISDKTESIIRKKARESRKKISDFAGSLLEEKVKEDFAEIVDNQYENPFKPFIGMFSSGKTDTSERMHEILYSEDFDPAEGFSVK